LKKIYLLMKNVFVGIYRAVGLQRLDIPHAYPYLKSSGGY
jgi:hypothetical protein